MRPSRKTSLCEVISDAAVVKVNIYLNIYISFQMYVIAEYKINGGENEIEIVPGSWYDESAQTCWWPH